MKDGVIISPLLAKVIQKFSEISEDFETFLDSVDSINAYEKFELVLTLNGEERLRVFEEGVQVEYI